MLSSLEYNYGEEVKEFANLLIGSTVYGELYLHVIIFNLMSQKLFSDHLRPWCLHVKHNMDFMC